MTVLKFVQAAKIAAGAICLGLLSIPVLQYLMTGVVIEEQIANIVSGFILSLLVYLAASGAEKRHLSQEEE